MYMFHIICHSTLQNLTRLPFNSQYEILIGIEPFSHGCSLKMPNNQNSLSDSGKSPQQMTANNICIRNNATSAAELYSQLLTCYGVDGAETLRNRRDFTMESQLVLIGGWWCLIMCWRSHFCCQMLFCLVENHDKAASWQGDRLSVLTPSARCLIDSVCVYVRLCVHPSVCVHVCVYCHGTVCVCACVCCKMKRSACSFNQATNPRVLQRCGSEIRHSEQRMRWDVDIALVRTCC